MNRRVETARSIADQIDPSSMSESLYSGVAGVALLYLELRDLQKAADALQWLIRECERQPAAHYGYYTGRLGVCDVLVRAYDVTGERKWLDAALRIARPGADHPHATSIADLLSGHAGAVIALLRLHARRPENWIVQWIDRLLARLVDGCSVAPAGVHWDRSGHQMQGLCGLSHGASGVGLAFLEAGRYFADEALLDVAREAFAYETACFDANSGNWPDFRRSAHTEDERAREAAALAAGRLDYFRRPADMNAWCHGALGIGLVRLRAGMRADVERAVRKTLATNWGDALTLCHGAAGAMVLFSRTGVDDSAIVDAIVETQRSGRPFRSGYPQSPGEDHSLMMGNAGIAYALLDPEDSILLPVCDAEPQPVRGDYEILGRSRGVVARRLLATRYPRTVARIGSDSDLPAMRAAVQANVDPHDAAIVGLDATIESRALLRVLRARRTAAAGSEELPRLQFGRAAECRRLDEMLLLA
ncbi:MAG: lanthionine synthetase LanC family protein, partial [Thermoanaerobaculia bacterium]